MSDAPMTIEEFQRWSRPIQLRLLTELNKERREFRRKVERLAEVDQANTKTWSVK